MVSEGVNESSYSSEKLQSVAGTGIVLSKSIILDYESISNS